MVRFAYADPPYEGQAYKYAREARAHGRVSREVDHPALIGRLIAEFPDGWALSCKTGSLRGLLPLVPERHRVMAWLKPFVPAYKGIRPVYSWEPVILVGGRAPQSDLIVKDSLVLGPQMGLRPRQTTGTLGAKPRAFCEWVLAALGYQNGDELVDLFPGSGVMSALAAQERMAL